MAPETHFAQAISACGPSFYVKGDLLPSDPSIQKIDIENAGFDSGAFDFVICNHILEMSRRPRPCLARSAGSSSRAAGSFARRPTPRA